MSTRIKFKKIPSLNSRVAITSMSGRKSLSTPEPDPELAPVVSCEAARKVNAVGKKMSKKNGETIPIIAEHYPKKAISLSPLRNGRPEYEPVPVDDDTPDLAADVDHDAPVDEATLAILRAEAAEDAGEDAGEGEDDEGEGDEDEEDEDDEDDEIRRLNESCARVPEPFEDGSLSYGPLVPPGSSNKKKPKRHHNPTDCLIVERRRDIVMEHMLNYMPDYWIMRTYCVKWNLTESTMRTNYITVARQRISDALISNREESITRHMGNRFKLYRRAVLMGDDKLALEILKDIAKLEGLYKVSLQMDVNMTPAAQLKAMLDAAFTDGVAESIERLENGELSVD